MRSLTRSSRLILLIASLFHLALLIGWRWQLPLVPYFFDATVLSGGRGLDFYSIYQAGYNARHGWDIYEIDPAQVEIVVPYFTPYRYLPIVAYTLGAAISLLSPLTAYKLWVVILELTLLLCVFLTVYLTPHDVNRAARLAAMWLVFTPFYLELFMGQFSLIQAALILGMLLAASRPLPSLKGRFSARYPLDLLGAPPPRPSFGRGGGAGGAGEPSSLLAPPRHRLPSPGGGGAGGEGELPIFDLLWIASVLWKINTIVLAPALLRLGRWRAVLLATLLVVVTTLPYFLIFPAHWLDLIRNNFGQGIIRPELGNLGFRQFAFALFGAAGTGPALQQAAQWVVVALAGGAALTLTLRRPAPSPATLLSLWLTAYFLASPQVWEHHYVMLLPALVVAYRARPSPLLLGIWLLLALPTPFGFIGLQPVIAANHDLRAFALEPAWQPILQHASKALPTLLLFAYFARQARMGQ